MFATDSSSSPNPTASLTKVCVLVSGGLTGRPVGQPATLEGEGPNDISFKVSRRANLPHSRENQGASQTGEIETGKSFPLGLSGIRTRVEVDLKISRGFTPAEEGVYNGIFSLPTFIAHSSLLLCTSLAREEREMYSAS